MAALADLNTAICEAILALSGKKAKWIRGPVCSNPAWWNDDPSAFFATRLRYSPPPWQQRDTPLLQPSGNRADAGHQLHEQRVSFFLRPALSEGGGKSLGGRALVGRRFIGTRRKPNRTNLRQTVNE